jgi:hypothetical protein
MNDMLGEAVRDAQLVVWLPLDELQVCRGQGYSAFLHKQGQQWFGWAMQLNVFE